MCLSIKLSQYMEELYESLKLYGFFRFQDDTLLLLKLKTARASLHTCWFSFVSKLRN